MKQYRHILLSFMLAIFIVAGPLFSQETIFTDNETHITYNREILGGFIAHTQGWGLNFQKNFFKTVDKRVNYEIQFNFTHNPKQKKIYNPFFRDAKGFYYGKLNTFFQLRGMYGQRRIIAHKIRSRGVEFGYAWSIGASFGFLKPIYLEIINYDKNLLEAKRYDPEIHDLGNIYGRAGGLNGFGEIMFRPGVFLKFGLFIEYSNKKTGISGIEAGVALDAYFQSIEIMADIQNQQFFPLLYINIFLGSKFNKY